METNPNPQQTISPFLQIARHPMIYAIITIVSVFWHALDREDNSKEEMLKLQDKLYQQLLEEVRKQVAPAVDKVNEAAIKVDSAATKVDSVAYQQQLKNRRR